MRARTKFAIMILVITVVLSGVVVGSHQFFQQQTTDDATEEVNATVRLTAEQIDETVIERRDYIGFIASQTSEDEFDRSEVILRDITRNSRFHAAHLVDRNRTIIDFQGAINEDARQDAIGSEVDDEHIEAAFDGQTVVSSPELAGDRHFITVSAPIIDQNGTVDGVITAAIFVDDRTFLGSTRPLETDTQAVSVIGPDGEPLKTADETFDEPIVATETIETTGWEVTVYQDRSELSQRLETLAIVQAGSLLIVLLTIVGFSIWEYQTNLKQAERLLEGFDKLGAGEYGHRLSLSAAEEWQQISNGFGHLAAELAEREATMRERGERLDVLNRVLRHNVRNEMSVIVNYADLITEFSDDQQVQMAAETILTSGRDLTSLSDTAKEVRNAFDDAERLVTFDVDALINNVVDTIETDYPDVNVSIDTRGGGSVAAIPALPTAIENVLENACEHNDADDPTVTIRSSEPDEGTVSLSIRDNGPGIPAHEYEVLERGEETALEHGSGLGLWLVHWIVVRSGGDLEFETADQRGTVVTVTLPSGDRIDDLEVSISSHRDV